jgi:hypothetical protein
MATGTRSPWALFSFPLCVAILGCRTILDVEKKTQAGGKVAKYNN